jgi:hypothetical protein
MSILSDNQAHRTDNGVAPRAQTMSAHARITAARQAWNEYRGAHYQVTRLRGYARRDRAMNADLAWWCRKEHDAAARLSTLLDLSATPPGPTRAR